MRRPGFSRLSLRIDFREVATRFFDAEEVHLLQQAIKTDPANSKVSLTIGSKNFPEQEILGEIYAQALFAAGYKVKSALNLGGETVARQSVKSGQISGYGEYASTALTARARSPSRAGSRR